MMVRRFLGALVVISLLIVAGCTQTPSVPTPVTTPSPAPVKAIEWRLQTCLAAGGEPYESTKVFASKVSELSGGRLKIEPYPGGTLYPNSEGLEAVGKNVSPMALMVGAYYSGVIGTVIGFESGVPGAEKDFRERYNFFYRGGFIELIREVFANYNVYYLAPHLGSGWNVQSKVPIQKVSDWKGLKIRASGLEADWYAAMGASPVLVAPSEIYTSLATGVIDAARGGGPDWNYAQGLHEVAKYIIYPPSLPVGGNGYFVNLDTWKALPDDLKSIVEMAAQYSSFYFTTMSAYTDAKYLVEMEKEGGKVNTIPDDEYMKMLQIGKSTWDKPTTDPYAVRALGLLKDYLAVLGR